MTEEAGAGGGARADRLRRGARLVAASCLAILAGLLPLFVLAHASRERTMASERERLDTASRQALQRTLATVEEARSALDALDPVDAPCSPGHIALMRQRVLDATSIEEIAFHQDGRLACTSWGQAEGQVAQQGADIHLPGGLDLDLYREATAGKGGRMLALGRGAHSILVRPAHLVGTPPDAGTVLVLATTGGRVIATSEGADPVLVSARRRSASTPPALLAQARGAGLLATAAADPATLQARLEADTRLLAPVALLASLCLLGVVAWLSRQRQSPQRELQIGLRRGELVTHYQPVMDLASGACIGAEALLRWRRPDGSWVPPAVFVPMAEQSGQIDRLTDLVIRQVVADLAGAFAAEPELHVSINLSARDLHSGRFLAVLEKALQRGGVAASRIWLEATERGFIDATVAGGSLQRARAAGHRVAIDDFGTGYSSLALLQSLPLDALKIDKAFVEAIGKDAATGVVTPHIIEMAHSLGLKIVAEGVETTEQAVYLAGSGVHYAQGWLYSRALPANEFLAWFQRRHTPGQPPLRVVA